MVEMGLDAVIKPKVDEKEADSEVEELADKFDALEELDMDLETDDEFQEAMEAFEENKHVVDTAQGGIEQGRDDGDGGLLGGLMSGKMAKVALAGAVGLGILTATQKLAKHSPALAQVNSMFGQAMSMFFRPVGNAVADVIKPFAEEALKMAKKFNEIAGDKGLTVALGWLAGSVLEGIGETVADAIPGIDKFAGGEKVEQAVGLASLIGGAIAASKFLSLLTSGAIKAASFLFGGGGFGGVLSGGGGASAASFINLSNAVAASKFILMRTPHLIAAGAIIYGTIKLSEYVTGEDFGDMLKAMLEDDQDKAKEMGKNASEKALGASKWLDNKTGGIFNLDAGMTRALRFGGGTAGKEVAQETDMYGTPDTESAAKGPGIYTEGGLGSDPLKGIEFEGATGANASTQTGKGGGGGEGNEEIVRELENIRQALEGGGNESQPPVMPRRWLSREVSSAGRSDTGARDLNSGGGGESWWNFG
jgi:hypothetical protein